MEQRLIVAPTGGRCQRGARRGFTLVELLVVIGIIAVLATFTVSVLRRVGQSSALDATAHAVRSLLRRARNSALEERYPCVVYLNVEDATISAQLKTSITRFRFEGAAVNSDDDPAEDQSASLSDEDPVFELEGSRGLRMRVENGEAYAGRFGQGLAFRKLGSEVSCWASIEHRPVLSPQEGVFLSCWIYVGDLEDTLDERPPRYSPIKEEEEFARSGEPAVAYAPRDVDFDVDDPPRYTIVRKGGAYAFALTGNYELELTLQGDERIYQTRTRPRTLEPGRWYEVAAVYDGLRVRILVIGIPRQHLPLQRKGKLPERLDIDRSPLSVSDSHPRRAFYGVIDELELAALVRSEAIELPPAVQLAAPTSQVVFDFMGELDAGIHAQPIAIYLSDAPPELEGASGDSGGTRTRGDDAARRLAASGGAYAKFRQRAKTLPEEQLQTIVIERTGLVR